ncbi:MAG TPA: hypothetical protein VFY85_03495 [Gemmatimonadaceae bacterium]|nr:hypothetical protein [Gemmatimonadaceae bacterium]
MTRLSSRAALTWARALPGLAILTSACGETPPARIEVPSDTVTVNSTLWTPVGIRVLDEHGKSLPDTLIHYAVEDTSLLSMSVPGLVNCHDDGTSAVTASAATVTARLVVRCRLVRRFGLPQFVELVAGGPAVPLEIVALDDSGNAMPDVRLQVTISDSTVIALRNGEVHGLKPGFARIEVGSSGRTGGEMFLVRAAKDSTDTVPRQSSALERAASVNRP